MPKGELVKEMEDFMDTCFYHVNSYFVLEKIS